MASYFVSSTAQYSSSTQTLIGAFDDDVILSDGKPGETTFELNEALAHPQTDVQYKGKVVIDGIEYPVFQTGFGNGVYLIASYKPLAEMNFPASLTLPLADTSSFTVCFAAGTGIATPNGERAVETLAIGDGILTADGRCVEVIWIGRQIVQKIFAGDRMMPVRIRAGALGEGLPHSDLTVTADHALILDGLAINAGALVNGSSIDWVPLAELPERVTYYHIETEGHDVILANGAAAETYVDYVGRQAFENYAEYVALYGERRLITEAPWPRISSPRFLPPALKARLGIGTAA
ncbi:Hint domain-containing protein [Roseicyclus persicicus]|uniref:Hint domain-containing protein n=1 Tax=Roseicyclus persicicus TaxID=2650661 RepID=A0A7X6GZQ2_9RHOB|nr:Hint domain-containing protein [Roseibacterium persicicum]NKX44719.1 Hint domain-containing protein [Roseibacterium persicicum]